MNSNNNLSKIATLIFFIALPLVLSAEALEGIARSINRALIFCAGFFLFIVQLIVYFRKRSNPGNKGSFVLVPCCVLILGLAVRMYGYYSKVYEYEKTGWEQSLTHSVSAADTEEILLYKEGIQSTYYTTIGYLSVISIFALFSSVHGVVIDYRRSIEKH